MPRKHKPLEILPRRLRIAMLARDMTSADIMRATKLGDGQISNYLNGHQEPGATRIAQLADALDVSADFLLGISDQLKPPRRPKKPQTKKEVEDDE